MLHAMEENQKPKSVKVRCHLSQRFFYLNSAARVYCTPHLHLALTVGSPAGLLSYAECFYGFQRRPQCPHWCCLSRILTSPSCHGWQ